MYSKPKSDFPLTWLVISILPLASLVLCFLTPAVATAKPGTHGRVISTWDTTRSSVVFSYERGIILEGGSSDRAGYNANFTSTSGALSSQFGLQYANLKSSAIGRTMHGGAISAAMLYGLPMGNRYRNGLPKAALSFFGGTALTGYTNGRRSFITLPLAFGMGVVLSPIRHLSIVPWAEGAVSVNLDSIFRYDEFNNRIAEGSIDDVRIDYGPNGEILNVSVDNSVVEDLVSDTLEYDVSVGFRVRGGISAAIHIGDRIDVQLNGTVTQMGTESDAPPTIYIGTALSIAWDDPPLAILPEESRAQTLSCNSVSVRYQSCSEYQALLERVHDAEARLKEALQKPQSVSSPPSDTSIVKPDSPPKVGASASEMQPAPTVEQPEQAVPAEDPIAPLPDTTSSPAAPSETTSPLPPELPATIEPPASPQTDEIPSAAAS